MKRKKLGDLELELGLEHDRVVQEAVWEMGLHGGGLATKLEARLPLKKAETFLESDSLR
jgi:hypothetical protein